MLNTSFRGNIEDMEHNMILSASGWRKVFAISNDEQDKSPEISENDRALCVVAANVFFDYISKVSGQENPVIALGIDTRPTGPAIADAMLHALTAKGAIIQYSGVTSAPEIMAYSRKLDGFIYVSASHNPVGHNGIKFGTNNGGVLNAQENAELVKTFLEILNDDSKVQDALTKAYNCSNSALQEAYKTSSSSKYNALHAYQAFVQQTITGTDNKEYQTDFFNMIQSYLAKNPLGIVCDFNGSSRAKCIDKEFFATNRINFYALNEDEIVHEIIPEAENLVHVRDAMNLLHEEGHNEVILGYMPDCDGDRGNIVYWDNKLKESVILKAQEVFSLSVLAELCYSIWQHSGEKDFKPAVVVNCPTSMRIEEIAHTLGAEVFRAEVGEANVVNCAAEKRAQGYDVRILGEGSNGGTITYPSSVRDPLNTIFAIIKLLVLKEERMFEIWCEKSGYKFNPNYTLNDILDSLPKYTTTGVSEPRAVLHVKNTDHEKLKGAFQKVFEKSWKEKQAELKKKYKIVSWEAVITNGTKETLDVKDFSLSKKGGLKIIFKDKDKNNIAFMWMRGSGTEPVFRIMCDVKGDNEKMEKELLEWETQLILESDK